jgi:hypothetical protein
MISTRVNGVSSRLPRLEAKQVDGQYAEDAAVKGHPEPEIRMHQNEWLGLR